MGMIERVNPRLVPKDLDIEPLHGGKSGCPGRGGGERDMGYRASAAAHAVGRFAPPEAEVSSRVMASRPAGGGTIPRCGSRLPCFRISRNRRAPPPYGLSSREPNDTALTSSGGGRVGAP